MKSYPSIPKIKDSEYLFGRKSYVFKKYDGSNLRFEWNKKFGWTKFGTRTRLFDKSDDVFGDAIEIFLNQLAPELEKVFESKYKGIQKIVVFCEYLGDNSFAGTHNKEDKKRLILFDVNLDKKGMVSPEEFVKNFGHLSFCAECLYEGVFIETIELSYIL